jgi:hypothetical protein
MKSAKQFLLPSAIKLQLIDYYDTSYWNSGEAKNPFVPPIGESVSDCLEKRIYSLRQSNYVKDSWVDVVDTYDKDGLCKPAAVFKIRQQCQLLCQAYIFALDWMDQQNDYDVPNKTWKECCQAACKHLKPCGKLAATTGETIARWNREFRRINKFLHPSPIVRSGKVQSRPFSNIFRSQKISSKHLQTKIWLIC